MHRTDQKQLLVEYRNHLQLRGISYIIGAKKPKKNEARIPPPPLIVKGLIFLFFENHGFCFFEKHETYFVSRNLSRTKRN